MNRYTIVREEAVLLQRSSIVHVALILAISMVPCLGCRGSSSGPPGTGGTRQLVVVDSIGVPDGDSEYMFGVIWGRCFLSDNRIAILDKLTRSVRVFSTEGAFIAEYVLSGSGPGQFTDPNRLSPLRSGGFLVAGNADRKVAYFDADGELQTEVLFTEESRPGPIKIVATTDSSFVMCGFYFAFPDSGGAEVALYTDSSHPEVIYRRRMALMDPEREYRGATFMYFTAGTDGRVYISDSSTERYSIRCYEPDGECSHIIDLPYTPVRKSQEQIDSEIERNREFYRQRHGTLEGFSYAPEEHIYPTYLMQAGWNGQLWVRSSLKTDTTFDVFDREGNYLYEVEAVLPAWQSCDGWSIVVSEHGFLASPTNPELYALVYILELVEEPVSPL